MTVIDEIAAERRRQIEKEGWSTEHDDGHIDGELARAAAGYALCGAGYGDYRRHPLDNCLVPRSWPHSWASKWWKPKNSARRNLIVAAALLVAEIERLDRAAESKAA